MQTFRSDDFEKGTFIVTDVLHYSDVIMDAIASQITSLTIVYSTVYSDADQRKHQSSAPLAFVRGFHQGPVNSPHKWPVTRKMFPFDDVIMERGLVYYIWLGKLSATKRRWYIFSLSKTLLSHRYKLSLRSCQMPLFFSREWCMNLSWN